MKRTLSKRECQVLKLILAEYSLLEISIVLEISLSRVYDIKSIIMEKWEIDSKNLMGLLLEGIRRGYVEVERDSFDITT
jgi:DNA-binding CsgD family transcriptional regulator